MRAKAKDNARLEEELMRLLAPASRTTVKKLIKNRRVAVEGEAQARPDFMVRKGQSIEVFPAIKNPKGKPGRPYRQRQLPFAVLHEDEHLVVVDKPAGLLTIATDKERQKTLYRMVSDYVKNASEGKKIIFIVHRLDRDVSGVIVFAKDEKTKRKLQDGWESAEKIYHAVVEGKPSPSKGTVRSWLCENRVHRMYTCYKSTKGAAEAITHYKTIRAGTRSFLEINIETGRKHQIRVHMASLGCPITGDRLYGQGKGGGGIALHAHKLSFDHPHTGKRVTIKSPMPGRFRGLA